MERVENFGAFDAGEVARRGKDPPWLIRARKFGRRLEWGERIPTREAVEAAFA